MSMKSNHLIMKIKVMIKKQNYSEESDPYKDWKNLERQKK